MLWIVWYDISSVQCKYDIRYKSMKVEIYGKKFIGNWVLISLLFVIVGGGGGGEKVVVVLVSLHIYFRDQFWNTLFSTHTSNQ